MKAQVAFEYIVMVGVIIGAVALISMYVYQQNEIATRSKQAEIAVNTIASAADNLYAQGPGAKTQINVYFPDGYDSTQSSLSGKTIFLRIYTPAGYNDIVATTKGNISGELPEGTGYKLLTLELINGYVNVTPS